MNWRLPLILGLIVINFSSAQASVLDSLRYVLVNGSQGVKWKSVRHRHEYSNPQLELAVKRIIDALVTNKLELDLAKLTREERLQLAFESIDSRTDLVDLLSIELKLRLEDTWAKNIGAHVAYDSSELWSLAKYRLKTLLDPETKLSTGITISRMPGMASTGFVLSCADRLQVMPKLRNTKFFSVGGIEWAFFESMPHASADILCGLRRFLLKIQTESTPATWNPSRLSDLFSNNSQIQVLGAVGLSATVSPRMSNMLKRFIEWRGGFELVSLRDAPLKETFSRLMESADLLNLAADIPNGNRFRLSLQSDFGQVFHFRKTKEVPGGIRSLDLHIVSPPLRTEENIAKTKNQQGVDFSFEELRQIFQTRKKPVAIIDLTCFSTKHLKNWIAPVIASGAQSAWIVGSQRGQAGETTLDIIPQMDLMLQVYDQMLNGNSLESIEQLLSEGSAVGHWMLKGFEWASWLGWKQNFNPSFLPMTHFEAPFVDLNSARQRTVITVTETETKILRRYNPSPLL